MVTSATMNPPIAPRATSGPTEESAVSGSAALRKRLQVQAAVATVQMSRMPVLLTAPETVIRSPITKPSDSNADGFNAGLEVRNSATKYLLREPLPLHYDVRAENCHSTHGETKGTDDAVPLDLFSREFMLSSSRRTSSQTSATWEQ